MKKKIIHFTANGKKYELYIDVNLSLLELLRDELGLTGVKCGCSVGECGACTVLLDGMPVDSCIYMAAWADGKNIRTVEGLKNPDGTLSEVQQAFVDEGAVQCGFCSPGFIMTATALAESGKKYSDSELKRELSGNLCRCTGYQNIFKAVKKVAGKGD